MARRDWPQEVADYAASKEVEQYLPAVLDMTRRLFPTPKHLDVRLEADWEIADQSYIVFEVEVAGLTVGQAVAARQRWMHELRRCCPSPRPGPFVLGLELVK